MVVVGTLGAIADRLPGWLAQMPGMISEAEQQRTALLDSHGCGRTLGLRIKPPRLGKREHFFYFYCYHHYYYYYLLLL